MAPLQRLAAIVSLGLAIFAAGAQSPPPKPQRGHDPWVFRCVLDKHPRMVVIALGEPLWAAYDATTCTLRKVWHGGVKFDGAVYTTVHGPQPTSEGQAYFESDHTATWQVRKGNTVVPSTTIWKGYRFENDQVTLMYTLRLDDSTEIGIEETPELAQAEGRPVLTRAISTSDVPKGLSIWHQSGMAADRSRVKTITAGDIAIPVNVPDATPGIKSGIPLDVNCTTTIRMVFETNAEQQTGASKKEGGQ